MTAALYNITIEQGADYVQPFPPILDSSGNPVNIMAASAAMQIRTAIGDPTAFLTLTTANGGLTASTGGVWLPFIDEDATTTILPGLYVYDLKMLNATGITSRPFQGMATITGEVTTFVLTPAGSFGQLNFSIAGNSGLAAGVF
jgi:hypothetical protein